MSRTTLISIISQKLKTTRCVCSNKERSSSGPPSLPHPSRMSSFTHNLRVTPMTHPKSGCFSPVHHPSYSPCVTQSSVTSLPKSARCVCFTLQVALSLQVLCSTWSKLTRIGKRQEYFGIHKTSLWMESFHAEIYLASFYFACFTSWFKTALSSRCGSQQGLRST